MRKFLRLASLLLALAPGVAAAEPVQIKPSLTRLNANLELPPGKTVGDGVVVIVHGMLSWYGQETVAALQKNLKAHGIGSLAITLSLGVDDRRGPRNCDVTHDYALAGAQREVSRWMDWLSGQKAKSVDLLGFSRGGAQVAAIAPQLPNVRKVVLMAPAFATALEQADLQLRRLGPTQGRIDAHAAYVDQRDDVGRLRLEEEVEGMVADRPGVQRPGERCDLELALHREAVRADRARIVPHLAARRAVLEHQLALAHAVPIGLALARRRRHGPLRLRCRCCAHAALRRMASDPSPMSP
jgi:dienelactone hydrolase